MILISVALVFGAAALLLWRRLQGRPAPVALVAVVLGAWAAFYAIVLGAVSLASEPRVLAPNEDKKFCGFYLDCHRQIAVVGVERRDSIGPTRPDGVFYVVTLRVSSDAKAAQLRFIDPRLRVADAAGQQYFRSAPGEAALALERGPQLSLTDPVGPGGAFLAAVVFDLPRDGTDFLLHVTDGWWADRLIEFFLVGDEDSFLHGRTAFRLTT
jgi:hypothetical protein